SIRPAKNCTCACESQAMWCPRDRAHDRPPFFCERPILLAAMSCEFGGGRVFGALFGGGCVGVCWSGVHRIRHTSLYTMWANIPGRNHGYWMPLPRLQFGTPRESGIIIDEYPERERPVGLIDQNGSLRLGELQVRQQALCESERVLLHIPN